MKIGILPPHRIETKIDLKSKLLAHGVDADVKVIKLDYGQFEENPHLVNLIAKQLEDCDVIVGSSWGAYFAFYAAAINKVDCLLMSAPLYKSSVATNRFASVSPEITDCPINVHMVCGGKDTLTKWAETKQFVRDRVKGAVTSATVSEAGYLFSEDEFFDELCNFMLEKKYLKLKQPNAKEQTADLSTSTSNNEGQSTCNSVSEQSSNGEVQDQQTTEQQPQTA